MLENSIFDDTEFLEGEILEQIVDLNKKEQEKVVEARREDVVVEPDSDMQVLAKVTVKGVTAGIDENIKPENIKLGVNILGIEGNVAPDKPDQEKTIYPSEEEQIVEADNGFELAKVIAKPVETESFNVAPSTSEQIVKASEGKYIKEVVVEAIEDLEPEIAEQEEELAGLEAEVNALQPKEKGDIQYMIDETNSCAGLFDNYSGTSLPFVADLDTSNVTRMNQMFNSCYALISLDLSNFKTNNVTYMTQMFKTCRSLTTLDLSSFDTSNVLSMMEMFYSCSALTSLDVSNFNTSKVTDMQSMFNGCSSLEELDLSSFDTSKVTNMNTMFNGCSSLITLDLSNFDTSNATVRNMFYSCSNLKTIIGKIDLINTSDTTNLFSSCKELEDVTLLNIKKSIKLSTNVDGFGTKLSEATLINMIQQLWDLTGETLQTLTLSSVSKNKIANIYVKLITPTQEQIDADPYINNKKPCVVCESTDDGAMTLTEYATTQKNWAIA